MNIIFPVGEFTIKTLETPHSTAQQWVNIVHNDHHQRAMDGCNKVLGALKSVPKYSTRFAL
jgi:hypothetical protein